MTYTLAWRPAQQMDEIANPPYDVWRDDDGTASTLFYRTPTGFLVRFLDGGDFSIDISTREVTCTPVPEVSEDYAQNLFSNQMLPMLWTFDGTPVLHASCVVVDGEAYGFLGRSGRGKSTLAAAFARYGHAFLSDDGMIVDARSDGVLIRPYLSSVRLLPDSQGALLGDDAVDADEDDAWFPKVRISASAEIPHANEPAPLRALYVLEEPVADQVIFTLLTIPAAVDALLQHSFFLDSHDKVRVRTHFRAMAKLAEAYPMYALDYPRDFDRLEQIVGAIASHARQRGA